MNGADTAWIIVATALVLFMTLPGLALFYGGLVRARNVLSVFMQTYAIACLMSVLWLVFGYSIAFGNDGGATSVWGGLGNMFLSGVTADSLSGTLPEVLFFAFQMTFAIITPALIVGAYVERIGFGFVLLFFGWLIAGALVMLASGHDLVTSFSASVACVANIGPGLGLVGPTDNYSAIHPVAKGFLAILMVVGRLEVLSITALLAPGFWRR